MDAVRERRDAVRLVAGLESGSLAAADAAILAADLDPVFVYMIVTFLRKVYPASDPAATSVLERVVQLMSHHPAVVSKHGEGERDPVSRWFEEDFAYEDFRGRGTELMEMIADKLDS